MQAKGEFEVKLAPQDDTGIESPLGRMTIDKQFHGDLEGISKGQMLAAMTAVQGSGVYVAIEKVTGTLQGRKGSFFLHHTGVMERGASQLNVTVVPDSGTEELQGLSGTLQIIVADGKHAYEFEYAINKTS